ncbi:MAG: type II secretion system minor pseudopilin GspI [Sulfuricaulis sp.]
MPRHQRGFTLVEVLVALAVLAIALAALMRAMGQAIDITAALRDHEEALWVAQNRYAEHQMRRDWPSVDTIDGDTEMGGTKWYWREQVSTTPEPKIRRIEITVRRQADSKETAAKLVGYLLNNPNTGTSTP